MCRVSRWPHAIASFSALRLPTRNSRSAKPRVSWRVFSLKRCPKLRINLTLGAVLMALAAGVGCRQDMHDQPKYIPLRPSDFFGDGRSERPLIEGTVARGHLDDDPAYYTGRGPDGRS